MCINARTAVSNYSIVKLSLILAILVKQLESLT